MALFELRFPTVVCNIGSNRSLENVKSFFETLKLSQEVIEVSKSVRERFKHQTVSFTLAYILYTRYIEIVRNLELIDPSSNCLECPDEYLEKLKACGWLLFVLQRSRV